MSLVQLSAVGQSFGPAAWTRQAWAEDMFIPVDIAVGPGNEVFVTGRLRYERDAWFETMPSDSSSTGAPEIVMLDVPPESRGFFAAYDGENGEVVFVRPGSVLSGDDYGRIGRESRRYGEGFSVAVVGDRVFHGEGATPLYRWESGAGMITVRDLQGALLHRIWPRETDFVSRTLYILGTGFDAQGNLYMAGSYTDTLKFSPDVVVVPSRGNHHATWDVFVASYSPDGTVRWAQQVEAGTAKLWVALGAYGKAAFDVDTDGNMVMGAVFYGEPPPAFSATEDGMVLFHYDRGGALQRIQTLEDLGFSYEPTFNELRSIPGISPGDKVPFPWAMRYDKRGNLYVEWVKVAVDGRTNSLTIGDSTYYGRAPRSIAALTKFDTQGTLAWVRHIEYDRRFGTTDMEVTEDGQVYVHGQFGGRYLDLGGVELTRNQAEGTDGFVAHYDENGHLVRTLQIGGSGDHSIWALAFGHSGDMYLAGRSTGDFVVLDADTLHARGEHNLFIAKYSAMSLSSEPWVEVPSENIEASNYPNPFRSATTITYRLPAPGKVRLTVYDMLGRELAVFVDERKGAGSHSARLDASAWPSGVYLYRLEAANQVATGRLVRRK